MKRQRKTSLVALGFVKRAKNNHNQATDDPLALDDQTEGLEGASTTGADADGSPSSNIAGLATDSTSVSNYSDRVTTYYDAGTIVSASMMV